MLKICLWLVLKVDAFFKIFSGGSVTAGLGIYDTMQYVQPPIATWCVGQACSMASLLLCAGEQGMRHSLPNSRVMIHQPSGQAAVSRTVVVKLFLVLTVDFFNYNITVFEREKECEILVLIFLTYLSNNSRTSFCDSYGFCTRYSSALPK